MAKGPPIEQQLLELSALRSNAKSVSSKQKFTEALAGKNNLLAARAATIIAETEQADFIPLLLPAFDRFFGSGSDKGCAAKTAIADALYTLGYAEAQAFLRGIRHIQQEPTYGGKVDAAAVLRGTCGLGLVRSGYRDALLELTPLLMDREPQTRQMGVRAVIYANQENGALLLRMKVLAGDDNFDVVAEALAGLMKISPGKSLEFVKQFLDDANPALAEAAAIAIGGSRTAIAFEVLRERWEHHIQSEPRAPLLLGMAMTRQPQAVEFLLQRIQDDSAKPAADAVVALAIYKHDEAVRSKAMELVKSRNDSTLTKAFDKAFYLGS